MERRPEQFPAPEAHEREPRFWHAEGETVASTAHPDRNEDALLGDQRRIDLTFRQDRANLSPAHAEALKEAARREQEAAPILEGLGIFGGLDGVSEGDGEIASRLAAAAIASELAKLPPEADERRTASAMAEAFLAAHEEMRALAEKTGRRYASTAVVFRLLPQEDGSAVAVYLGIGDSRLYRRDRTTGKLEQLTEDDSPLTEARREGKITKEEAEAISWALTPEQLPAHLQPYWEKANNITACLDSARAYPKAAGSARLQPGDSLVFASDGVYANLGEGQIAKRLQKGGAREVVSFAERVVTDYGGAPDDLTCFEVKYGEPPAAETKPDLGQLEDEASDAATEEAELNGLLKALEEANVRRADPETLMKINVLGGPERVKGLARAASRRHLEAERRLLRAQRATGMLTAERLVALEQGVEERLARLDLEDRRAAIQDVNELLN